MELNLYKAIFSEEVNDKPGHMLVARFLFDGHQSRGLLEHYVGINVTRIYNRLTCLSPQRFCRVINDFLLHRMRWAEED